MGYEQIAAKIKSGFGLIKEGQAIIAEVRENIAAGQEALSTDDIDELNAMLDKEMAESEAVSARIQNA